VPIASPNTDTQPEVEAQLLRLLVPLAAWRIESPSVKLWLSMIARRQGQPDGAATAAPTATASVVGAPDPLLTAVSAL
jgi:hypothetical protein